MYYDFDQQFIVFSSKIAKDSLFQRNTGSKKRHFTTPDSLDFVVSPSCVFVGYSSTTCIVDVMGNYSSTTQGVKYLPMQVPVPVGFLTLLVEILPKTQIRHHHHQPNKSKSKPLHA